MSMMGADRDRVRRRPVHRKSERRIRAAKKAARPELCKKDDWSCWTRERYSDLDYYEEIKKVQSRDGLSRIAYNEVSVDEFRDKWEKAEKPVVITGVTDGWLAQEKWTFARILKKYRNQKFKCGEDDDGNGMIENLGDSCWRHTIKQPPHPMSKILCQDESQILHAVYERNKGSTSPVNSVK